jgi:DNA-binding transcriptional MerR regulator
MRIKEFSERLGISSDTVLRLERAGLLLPVRDWAGHRRYTNDDVERAREFLFGKDKKQSLRRPSPRS